MRVYDIETQTLVKEHPPGNMATRGHGNRVTAIRLLEDGHTFVSAGWDRNFIFWDLRKSACVEQFMAVKVGGEAMDVKGGHLLVG